MNVEAPLLIEELSVGPIVEHYDQLRGQLAQIYYQTWNPYGLCGSLREAEAKMHRFNPAFVRVAQDLTGEVHTMVWSLPVRASSLFALAQQYPTYASVEHAAMQPGAPLDANIALCFSVNAGKQRRRVLLPNQTTISQTKLILSSLDHDPMYQGLTKTAYSRLDGNPTETHDPLAYFFAHLKDSTNLGPLGLHMHLGAVPIGILMGSRPEDTRGGGANAIAAYLGTHVHEYFKKLGELKFTRDDAGGNPVAIFYELSRHFPSPINAEIPLP